MESPAPDHLLKLGTGFFASKVLLSAVELQLFTVLAEGPETLAGISSRIGLHPRSARDFLDALVALDCLVRNDGRYANTPATAQFLDKNKPAYIGGILEMANARLYGFWGNLTTALRTGQPQNEASRGEEEPFKVLYSDPDRLRGFLRAMTGISRGANLTIGRQFPWKDYNTVVDVGTAQGDLVTQVALANPHLQGIGFDLPQVGPCFEEYIAANGLSERVCFNPGSFFDAPIPKADVVMMGHILHDWDLDVKKMLVRKAYDALPEGGAFLVYESIIDDDRSQNAFGLLMSLNMLIETPGGFDYTGADCMGWMKEAGFRDARVEHLVGPESMVIGIK
jgi:O-methyltransferase/methyltransferase family protein